MTVIKGNNKTAYFIRPGSSQVSDTESLHLGSASASDTESLNNEPTNTARNRIFQALPLRPIDLEEPVTLKKSSGKKKLRRYQNRCVLQTLQEEDESENTLIVIVDPYKSPFARLLEDSAAMQFWNDFIEKTEEEQTDIINAFSEQYRHCQPQKNDNSLGRISSRVKRTFKSKKNLSVELIKDCEDQLLKFFNLTPQNVYVKSPSTSFDRMLLKAIAHYHGLQIKNIISPEENLKPCIEVFNTQENWEPANCFLTDFIQQLR